MKFVCIALCDHQCLCLVLIKLFFSWFCFQGYLSRGCLSLCICWESSNYNTEIILNPLYLVWYPFSVHRSVYGWEKKLQLRSFSSVLWLLHFPEHFPISYVHIYTYAASRAVVSVSLALSPVSCTSTQTQLVICFSKPWPQTQADRDISPPHLPTSKIIICTDNAIGCLSLLTAPHWVSLYDPSRGYQPSQPAPPWQNFCIHWVVRDQP